MKPGRLNVCIVFVFGCCAAVVPALAADPTSKFDPKIMQGRPIGDWFKQASDKDQATRDKATEVILQCLTNRDQAFRSNLHSWLCGNAAVGMPVVIKGLDHEDSEIRDESAYVLGHMPYSAATILPILRAKFKSAELLNRLALAEAILYLSPPSKDHDEEFLSVMKQGCADKELATRGKAYTILGRARQVSAGRPLLEKGLSDNDADVRIDVACSLCGRGPVPKEALTILDDALADPDKAAMRLAILTSVQRAGPAAKNLAPTLADVLCRQGISDQAIRTGAIEALASLGDESAAAVPELCKSLKSSNLKRNLAALVGLRRLGFHAAAAVPALLDFYKVLQSDEAEPKAEVVETLAACEPRDNKEALAIAEELFKGDDAALQLRGAELLWAVDRTQAKTVMPELLKALDDRNLALKAAAILQHMGADAKDAVAPLTEKLKEGSGEWSMIIPILEKIGPAARPAVPVLVGRLKSKPPYMPQGHPANVVLHAIDQIGMDPKTVAPLAVELHGINTLDIWTRNAALDLLGRCGAEAKGAVPALTRSVNQAKGSYDGVRFAEVLLQIDPETNKTVVAAYTDMMRNKANPPMPEAAGLLYGINQDPDARQVLLDALEGKDSWRCRSAILALGKLGPKAKELAPSLAKCLESERTTDRVDAALALWRIDPKYRDDLPGFVAGYVASPDMSTRYFAVHALGEMGRDAKGHLDVLRAARPDMQRDADEAIAKIEAEKEEHR